MTRGTFILRLPPAVLPPFCTSGIRGQRFVLWRRSPRILTNRPCWTVTPAFGGEGSEIWLTCSSNRAFAFVQVMPMWVCLWTSMAPGVRAPLRSWFVVTARRNLPLHCFWPARSNQQTRRFALKERRGVPSISPCRLPSPLPAVGRDVWMTRGCIFRGGRCKLLTRFFFRAMLQWRPLPCFGCGAPEVPSISSDGRSPKTPLVAISWPNLRLHLASHGPMRGP